ncbi:uncharacterized protein BCR38DRAFT_522418 [Pseudomassariella vexata]|uniref:Uncharacterized protein n=1 Tax=Pseudomassariella vexata TaxID=1141098 RepID=A0A1Y2E7F7_9PEZI|nr:uncharacterized protein BCR38DRAFT_522418 [Pseudomassariella vexata]ORY67491.1 hypothetical protein BCR38DRAFT_522418 [Pseudomassariella vexata]
MPINSIGSYSDGPVDSVDSVNSVESVEFIDSVEPIEEIEEIEEDVDIYSTLCLSADSGESGESVESFGSVNPVESTESICLSERESSQLDTQVGNFDPVTLLKMVILRFPCPEQGIDIPPFGWENISEYIEIFEAVYSEFGIHRPNTTKISLWIRWRDYDTRFIIRALEREYPTWDELVVVMKEHWNFADYTQQKEPTPLESDSLELESSTTSSLKSTIDTSDAFAFDQGKTDSTPAALLGEETTSDEDLAPDTDYEKNMLTDDYCFDQVADTAVIPQNVDILNTVVLEESRPPSQNSAVRIDTTALTQFKSPDQDKTEAVEISNSSQVGRIRTECSHDNTSFKDHSLLPRQFEKRGGRTYSQFLMCDE